MNKQLAAKNLGESGCYFFSLLYHAEKITGKSIDAIALYDKSVSSGWCDAECFMQRPDAMMADLLGKKVKVFHADLSYKPKANEYEITRYERKATGTTYAHFVATKNGRVVYDPYGKSKTVTEGKPVSKRIISVLN